MKKKISDLGGSIWHFTDKSNCESIKASGLLSWKNLVTKGMVPAKPGGNKWSHDADELVGVDRYVHLAFSKQHPMLHVAMKDGRIENPVWIRISLDVLDLPGVMFTNDVANKAGVGLFANEDAKSNVDVEAIYKFLDFKVEGNQERKCAAEKSQILVPDMIAVNYILGYE